MTRDRKDRSANWLVEHHGDSLLHLADIKEFTDWRPAPTVLTFPKQLPDGLLDVTFRERLSPDPFLLEIETYPDQDTVEQIRRDAAMVLLARRVLPDILLVVLSPKGKQRISPSQLLRSAHGLTELRLKIRVVNLWEQSAERLLAADDVGLIPWVPLAKFKGSPAALMEMCRERIDRQAPPAERGNLLAATRVMAEMRYNDPQLLSLLGGQIMSLEKVYLASPSVQFFMAKTARETMVKGILRLLKSRFGSAPESLAAQLRTINDQEKLDDLLIVAAKCDDLKAFRAAVNEG